MNLRQNLRQIVKGLEQERQRIDRAIDTLQGLYTVRHFKRHNGNNVVKMTAKTREKMSKAQKARWEKKKAA